MALKDHYDTEVDNHDHTSDEGKKIIEGTASLAAQLGRKLKKKAA